MAWFKKNFLVLNTRFILQCSCFKTLVRLPLFSTSGTPSPKGEIGSRVDNMSTLPLEPISPVALEPAGMDGIGGNGDVPPKNPDQPSTSGTGEVQAKDSKQIPEEPLPKRSKTGTSEKDKGEAKKNAELREPDLLAMEVLVGQNVFWFRFAKTKSFQHRMTKNNVSKESE